MAVAVLSSCVSARSPAAANVPSGGTDIRPVPVTGIAPASVTLQSVRQQWNGSRAQIRFPAKLRKSKGWAQSKWMNAPTLPGEKKMRVRLLVSDYDLVRQQGRLSARDEIRAGTFFVIDDWQLTYPNKERGLVIDMHFEDTPVRARLEYGINIRLSDIEQAERVARIELFQPSEPPVAAPDGFVAVVPDIERTGRAVGRGGRPRNRAARDLHCSFRRQCRRESRDPAR